EGGAEFRRAQRKATGIAPERRVEPAIDRKRARDRRDLEIRRRGGTGRQQEDEAAKQRGGIYHNVFRNFDTHLTARCCFRRSQIRRYVRRRGDTSPLP